MELRIREENPIKKVARKPTLEGFSLKPDSLSLKPSSTRKGNPKLKKQARLSKTGRPESPFKTESRVLGGPQEALRGSGGASKPTSPLRKAALIFPCNQFGAQEPGNNEQIQEFVCTRFKAKFPVFDKIEEMLLLWHYLHEHNFASSTFSDLTGRNIN